MRNKALILSVLLACFLMHPVAGAYAQPEPLKIGVSYPLTGFLAVYGEAQKRGAELAAEEINKAGGVAGHKLKLIIEDNGFEAKKQMSAVRKLIDLDKIDLLLTGWTPLTVPIVPVIEEAKVPAFTWMVADAGQLSPWLFNLKNDFALASRQLVKRAAKDGIKKIAFLAVMSDELVSSRQAVMEEAGRVGIEVTSVQEFSPQEADFRSVLIRLKAGSPEAILLAGYPGNWATVVQQLSGVGLDKLRLYDLSMAAPDPEVSKSQAAIVEKMQTVSNWYSTDPAHETTGRFIELFRSRFGTVPQPYSAYSYDSLKLMAAAADICYGQKTDFKACVKDELLKVGTRDGAAGVGVMDEDGDFELPITLVKIENGSWKYLH